MEYIVTQNKLAVIDHVDVAVVGGSCTGLFAAVRAAQLGARVAVMEKNNCFGGTAVTSFVNNWHSIYDTDYNRPVAG